MNTVEIIRKQAETLLTKGEISCFIGFGKGQLPHHSPPLFIDKAQDATQLIWDEYCIANLAKYLLNFSHQEGKIGLVVKGCDSRGVLRLIQDKQLTREKLLLIGVPCRGMKDVSGLTDLSQTAGLPLAAKCLACLYPNPVIYDILAAAELEPSAADRFKDVDEIEKLDIPQRHAFWQEQFSRCIRCYACRNICPACSCRQCYLEVPRVDWHGKAVDPGENVNFNLTRAMHVAGRCIECGECERACPVGIPIMAINKKIIREIGDLFGSYDAGVELAQKPPLSCCRADDPDTFESRF